MTLFRLPSDWYPPLFVCTEFQCRFPILFPLALVVMPSMYLNHVHFDPLVVLGTSHLTKISILNQENYYCRTGFGSDSLTAAKIVAKNDRYR